MEEAYKIFDYLPITYRDGYENDYVDTLFKAFTLSYENQLYQFAYLQFHMLFMVSLYFVLLKVEKVYPQKFHDAIFFLLKDRVKKFNGKDNTKKIQTFNEKGALVEKQVLYFGSFAAINESDVLRLLKIIGVDSDLHCDLKKLVNERNIYAHANGNMTIKSEETINEKIEDYMCALDKVFRASKKMIQTNYENNLIDPLFYDLDYRIEADDTEQIKQELIKEYSLSKTDLNYCRKYDIRKLENNEGFEYMKLLHIRLCQIYKEI